MEKTLKLESFMKAIKGKVCYRVDGAGRNQDFGISFSEKTIADIERVNQHLSLVLCNAATGTMLYRLILGDIFEENYLQEYWVEENEEVSFVIYNVRTRLLCVNGNAIVNDIRFCCEK